MNSKKYRSYLVECVKTAGNMIIDMADDIVGETDHISDLATEDFLAYEKNGDFDTVGALYLIKSDGERVEVNRYFSYDDDYNIKEIDKDEYERRRQLANDLLKVKGKLI